MKKILSMILLFNLFLYLTTPCFASSNLYLSMPIWTNDTLETSGDVIDKTQDNFLKLESESAILIEQNTRKSII